MKKKDVQSLRNRRGEKTAEYVVAHAKWQCSRNRKPSESYKEESNPKRALALAIEELKTFDPMAGTDVSFAADKMVKICHLTGNSVTAQFNDVELVAFPGDVPKSIVKFFHKESERRGEEYRMSPEGKRAAREAKERQESLQKKADEMVEQLFDKFDFANLEAVINWLDEFQNPSYHVGVKIPHEQIVKKFREHGFEPNVNCGDDFNEADKDNVARWIVGQALAGLECDVHAIHQVFHKFAKDWRNKFISKPVKKKRSGTNTVTKLVKKMGDWSNQEISAIVSKMAEIESLPAKPNTIVLMNELPEATIIDALGHSDFTSEEVDYQDRWS